LRRPIYRGGPRFYRSAFTVVAALLATGVIGAYLVINQPGDAR